MSKTRADAHDADQADEHEQIVIVDDQAEENEGLKKLQAVMGETAEGRAELDRQAAERAVKQAAAEERERAARDRRRKKFAEDLRRADTPADAEYIREEWRAELGADEEIGDFVVTLMDGSRHRMEVAGTRHNGQYVVGVLEDPQ